MKTIFRQYYRPTEEEFRQLWNDCVFAFDANVLLNIYRYSEPTTKQLLDLLQRLASRIWMPHEFALEYHRNRLQVIMDQVKNYEEAETTLKRLYDQQLLSKQKHPFLSDDKIQAYRSIQEDLATSRTKLEALLTDDPYVMRLTAILTNIGKRPDDLQKLYQQAKSRYQERIPPGYADLKEKGEPDAYGDYVGWAQLIEISKAKKKPIIFVTDDAKEDWWQIVGFNTIGPRPELIAEFITECDQMFYMYPTSRFIELAEGYLGAKVEQGAVDEIRERSKEQLPKPLDIKPINTTVPQDISDQKPFILPEVLASENLKPNVPPDSLPIESHEGENKL
jgi:hypothetical protein